MIVTSVLLEFREFLLANFHRISNADPETDVVSFWIQANWEVLVEQKIAHLLGCHERDVILPAFGHGIRLGDWQDESDDDHFRIRFRDRKITHLLMVNGEYYRFSSLGTKTNFGDNYLTALPFDTMECISKYGQTTYCNFLDGMNSSAFSVSVITIDALNFYDPTINN